MFNKMLKKSFKILLGFVLIYLVLPSHTYAYLDAGSGSYLIQIIIASLAGFGYLIKLNWKKLKNIFTQKEKKGLENEKKDRSS